MAGKGLESTVVYIVDDDAPVREGFARLLRAANLEPRAYATAEQFLDEFRPEPRACVLLDLSLPHLAAWAVQAQLKERLLSLPVIAISARDDAGWARCLGANLFLRKPVDDQALLDAIEWVIGGNGA